MGTLRATKATAVEVVCAAPEPVVNFRIKVLATMETALPERMRLGAFEFDLKTGELRDREGKARRLQEQPFQILLMLVRHRGLVTREEIQKKLWPNDTVVEFDHSIHTAINKLRQVFGDSAEDPKYVETVARRGYRLVVSVERLDAIPAAPPSAVVAPVPEPSASSLSGKRVSHYRVLEVLGGGGMGVVYKAEDLKLGRRVALKFLPEEIASDAKALERFEREARAASALDHPNICTIHEFGEHEGQPFIVMTLLEGQTLRDRITATAGAFGLPELLKLAVQIADGLAAAHEKGVIHRDIKPANIFITNRDEAKILDFGLAKLTDVGDHERSRHEESQTASVHDLSLSLTGLAMGTVPYMSPEQIRGEKLDARSDLFSCGLVIYEMATWQQAFRQETAAELHEAILNRRPVPARELNPALPPRLEEIINKALEKDRNLRYQTAAELRADLLRLQRDTDSGRATSRALRSRKTLDSIAVLPFENASANPDAEYLSDGITESIIGNLTHLPKLRVMARSTVFRYKGRVADPQKVGNELNVRTVLTGRLLQRGDSLTIGTELVDVANGWRLWGEQYSRKLSDLLAVQEEIANEISKTLQLSLTGDERKRLSKRPTYDAQAYQDYLRGRFHWNKRTADGVKKGIEHFKKAIEKDPSYPLAYVGLADSYNILGFYAYAAPRDAYPKAKAAALRALEIDDALAEAQASLADVKLYYDWDWSGAEKEFNRVVERNPAYATGHLIYGDLLTAMGRFKEGMAETEKAQELDPLSMIINAGVGWCFYFARQYDKAIEQLRKALEMDQHFVPGHAWLGGAYLQQGLFSEGITELRAASEISGGSHLYIALLAHAYGVAGDKAQAQKILGQLKDQSARSYVSSYSIGEVCLGLGDRNQALDWLEKAYEERARALVMLKVEPKVDPLRSDPRFQDLICRMNFPP